jgi:hypothetical protein
LRDIAGAVLPISTRSVFRNRWWTLAWAAGIVWTALEVAGSPDAQPASANGSAQASAAAADDQARQAAAIVSAALH